MFFLQTNLVYNLGTSLELPSELPSEGNHICYAI